MLRSAAGSATPVQPVADPNHESGPNASVQCWGPVRKDSHRCSRGLPIKRSRKLIPPDRRGLFYEVAGSLRHAESRALTGAEVMITNFFCRFSGPRQLHRDQGRNFKSHLIQEVFAMPESKQDMHHAPATAIGRHARALYQNGQGAPTEGRRITPEGLGHKTIHLPPCLQSIYSRHYKFDHGYRSVRERTLTALRPAIWGAPPTRNDPQSITWQI
jgi:hypothetical protein